MSQGVLCRSLEGHGHWVNSLALNTDYVIRTGAVDPTAAHRGKANQSEGELSWYREISTENVEFKYRMVCSVWMAPEKAVPC